MNLKSDPLEFGFSIYQKQFQILDRVLKFHGWILHQKITALYFFNLDYLPMWSYAPFKGS